MFDLWFASVIVHTPVLRMKLTVSGVRTGGNKIPFAQNIALCARYCNEYKAIFPSTAQKLDDAPYCLSERSGMADFEICEPQVAEFINEELIIDLFGIFKIGQKGKEDTLMLPLAST